MGKFGTAGKGAATVVGVGIAIGLLALGSHAVLSAKQPQATDLPRAAADALTSPSLTDPANPSPVASPSPSPTADPTPVQPALPPARAVASPIAAPTSPTMYCGYAYQPGPFPLEPGPSTPVYSSCAAAIAGDSSVGTVASINAGVAGVIRTPQGNVYLLFNGDWIAAWRIVKA